MTRRTFMKTVAAGMQMGLGSILGRPAPSAHGAEAPPRPDVSGVSLREIARRRLHHGGDRFINPFNDTPHGGMGRVLVWKLFSRSRFRRFYADEPRTRVSVDIAGIRADAGVSVTLLRHASLMIQDRGEIIMVDPVYYGLFGFIRDFAPFDFDPLRLPSPHQVLITHGHYDHLDLKTLAGFDPGTPVISPLGYEDTLQELNLTRHRELDWFETTTRGGRQITLLPCSHWSMRNPLVGPNRSLWGSYLIRTAGGPTIYVSGDTGYFKGFEEIGRQFDIDLAVFNLGAYEPRWFMRPSHMNPEETLRAVEQLGARRFTIAHWGTFRLGDEPVHFPPMETRRLVRENRMEDRLVDLGLGRTFFFDGKRIA